ncbi:hypothetical protein M9Y10_006315 [Tritrichomonas musculus]|uniref:Calpain catalytic domain-containing protein n=1 Tax=Tritrichomonas musculus TaxID=1915356 RepID=A0ABR2JG13_9EUKA
MKHYEDFFIEAQQYSDILKRYRENGEIFKDPNFHPNSKIKETQLALDKENCTWRRIDEFYTAPLFKKELISEEAVEQGEINDSYFISSLIRIAKQPEIVPKLFDTRSISEEKEDTVNLKCGAVVIYFHVFGRRTPVLIDTLIPFKRGSRNPLFSRPTSLKYSAWFCLVEKAYAKLQGSYTSIINGTLSQGIYHLFGYYPCFYTIDSLLEKMQNNQESGQCDSQCSSQYSNQSSRRCSRQNSRRNSRQNSCLSEYGDEFDVNDYIFSRLMKWQYQNSIIGTDIYINQSGNEIDEEEIRDKGLVPSRTYLIEKVRYENNQKLICLRNPKNDKEWLGDWSNTSPMLTFDMKKKIGNESRYPGTFWMNDRDFFRYFSSFDVCKAVNPEFHVRSIMTKLEPGDHDGYDIKSEEVHLEERQAFVFKMKNVRVRMEEYEEEEEEAFEENIQIVDDVKIHVTVEKRSPKICSIGTEEGEGEGEEDCEDVYPQYQILVVYSNGQRVSHSTVENFSRQTFTTSGIFFKFTIHVLENEPFVIVLTRKDKRRYTEECYMTFSSEYDFELRPIDETNDDNENSKEEEKVGIIFSNESKRYENVAREIITKNINDEEVKGYSDKEKEKEQESEFGMNFYRHLKLKRDLTSKSGFYEYEITDDENEDDKIQNENHQTFEEFTRSLCEILEISPQRNIQQSILNAVSNLQKENKSLQKQLDELSDQFTFINNSKQTPSKIFSSSCTPGATPNSITKVTITPKRLRTPNSIISSATMPGRTPSSVSSSSAFTPKRVRTPASITPQSSAAKTDTPPASTPQTSPQKASAPQSSTPQTSTPKRRTIRRKAPKSTSGSSTETATETDSGSVKRTREMKRIINRLVELVTEEEEELSQTIQRSIHQTEESGQEGDDDISLLLESPLPKSLEEANARILSLEDKIRDLCDEINNLTLHEEHPILSENEKKASESKEMARDFKAALKKIQRLQKKLDERSKPPENMKQFEDEISRLKSELQESARHAQELQETLNTFSKSSNNEMARTSKNMKRAISRKDEEIKKRDLEIERATKKGAEIVAKYNEQQQKMNKMISDMKILNEKHENSLKANSKLKEQIKLLQIDLEQANSYLESYKGELGKLDEVTSNFILLQTELNTTKIKLNKATSLLKSKGDTRSISLLDESGSFDEYKDQISSQKDILQKIEECLDLQPNTLLDLVGKKTVVGLETVREIILSKKDQTHSSNEYNLISEEVKKLAKETKKMKVILVQIEEELHLEPGHLSNREIDEDLVSCEGKGSNKRLPKDWLNRIVAEDNNGKRLSVGPDKNKEIEILQLKKNCLELKKQVYELRNKLDIVETDRQAALQVNSILKEKCNDIQEKVTVPNNKKKTGE